jgi:hypothetical protein
VGTVVWCEEDDREVPVVFDLVTLYAVSTAACHIRRKRQG